MVDQIVSILGDDRLQEGFLTKPDIKLDAGERIYGELNTGEFWEGAQMEAPPVTYTFLLTFLLTF
jgi:hypothetical protein